MKKFKYYGIPFEVDNANSPAGRYFVRRADKPFICRHFSDSLYFDGVDADDDDNLEPWPHAKAQACRRHLWVLFKESF